MKPLNEIQIVTAVKMAFGKMDREKVKQSYHKIKNIPDVFISFTAQELRVANMIRGGKKNSEIATELGLSKATVSWHRKKIRRNLGIDDRKRDLTVFIRATGES